MQWPFHLHEKICVCKNWFESNVWISMAGCLDYIAGNGDSDTICSRTVIAHVFVILPYLF